MKFYNYIKCIAFVISKMMNKLNTIIYIYCKGSVIKYPSSSVIVLFIIP